MTDKERRIAEIKEKCYAEKHEFTPLLRIPLLCWICTGKCVEIEQEEA